MPELSLINKAGQKLDSELISLLQSRISDWQQDNKIPVTVVINSSASDTLFDFKFTKAAKKVLELGVNHNLLKADISNIFRPYAEFLAGKVQFVFYVGLNKEELNKIMPTDKPVLNISPSEPLYSLSQVILSQEVKKEIDSVVALLRNMGKIYYEWGFDKIDPVPRSIVNLWGPPGTGKTMTVHAISKEMGKKILVLNYADIESKYVGEAPKNLIAAFDLAEEENAVIFFDEADSFLGNRITNVEHGNEQAINSLRSQMLMKLEAFKGIVFFATNLHENYDKAFESRILKHIEFKLPDAFARKTIIKSKLPIAAPYAPEVRNDSGAFDDTLLASLAQIIDGFSGREIKNCILELLVRASQTEHSLITADLMKEVFTAKKVEFDSIKNKEKERKDKLSKQIQHNLKTNNYKVKKIHKRSKK